MREIHMPDPRILNSERTFFDADYTSGTILTVINNAGFNLNDIAVTGEPGTDHSEAQQVLSIVGVQTINIAASFNYAHNKGVSVYRSSWNQVSLEGQPLNGTFSQLTLMPIMWDEVDTVYVHLQGDDSWNYRFRFYNSYNNTYSAYSPTLTGIGLTRRMAGQMIINARKKVRDPNINRFGDEEILTFLQDAQTQIELAIPKLWFLKVNTWEHSNGIQAVGNQFKYNLSGYSDFNYLHKIQYVLPNNTVFLKWDLETYSEIEYDRITFNQLRPSNDYVRKYKLLEPDSAGPNGYFETYPTPLTAMGTFYPTYYRHLTPLTNVTIQTDLPFPEILEDYAAWRMHVILGNTGTADNPGGMAAYYKSLFYGPEEASPGTQLNGIALLKQYNTQRKRVQANGRQLFNFRGHKGINNYYGNGIGTRDFNREFFMN